MIGQVFFISKIMITYRSFKTELKPNNKQATFFSQCAGAARFVYNWALRDRMTKYESGEKSNMFEQKKRFNALKKDEYPWLYDVPYTLQEQAFANLDAAYKNFFRRIKNGETPGFPKFKKRGVAEAFTLRGNITIEEKRIKLPVIGYVTLKESGYLPTKEARILAVTISKKADRWYLSAQCEIEIDDPCQPTGNPLGIDTGIKSLAVFSDGRTFDNPKTLNKHEKKLARLQRELARRKKGSANRQKTKHKIAKLHAKIGNTRKHTLHNISAAAISSSPETIVIEDLNVLGMMKNEKLAKAVADSSMGELHRQIKYKAVWHGIEVLEADRWYPSSKTCSACGHKKETLALSERIFTCDNCGAIIDRDYNAAMNLAALAKAETQPDCLGS